MSGTEIHQPRIFSTKQTDLGPWIRSKGMDYGGKPLDGVSQVEALWSKIDEKYEVRDEILQYINPYERISISLRHNFWFISKYNAVLWTF